ncbi:PolC-type DNA polymerase III [Cyanobium sp. Cruz-8H5]|uniref:3'-5' exonuclease n=1 Tax=Cyanobium sp. Cruz-8H5 TaxID=2823712 RepID=UPI0020CD6F0B|nr:3'-5' exonuclease [Cyanobium sp. Cruz-8H5]MCP9861296.1 3'-5' exonuclease [Cyanobium sp. Cruz-8H5]MCP9868548.1 3'-5' exonuclease [Cyanobium sp. Cruz-8D1]
MPQLLPAGAKGFAVLDLETTGTGQLCRIVEIALLLLSPDGEIEQEWSTVINPGVPIPNAAVHGIDERLAAAAPSFPAVAPALSALLQGRVLVAHNLDRFDGPILRHHFWEASEALPELVLDLGDGIDTMPNPFISLGKLCAARGINLSGDDAHTALGDTRALAALLRHGLPHLHPSLAPVRVAGISGSELEPPRLLPRTSTSRQGLLRSHDWLDTTVTIPAAGGTIALHGEDAHGWDFKVQKALAHATTLGLVPIPFQPDVPADVLVVSSLFIDSPVMRRLRNAGHPVVASKVFQEARAGATVAANRWGER